MKPIHIIISAGNLLCLAFAIATIITGYDGPGKDFIGSFAVFGGIVFNVLAVLIMLATISAATFINRTNTTNAIITSHWLGILNGIATLTIWLYIVFFTELLGHT